MLVSLVLAAIAITLYYCLLLPRLRRLRWWDGAVAEFGALFERAYARLRAFCGNSKTIAVAYAAELLGVLDEAKVLDWGGCRRIYHHRWKRYFRLQFQLAGIHFR